MNILVVFQREEPTVVIRSVTTSLKDYWLLLICAEVNYINTSHTSSNPGRRGKKTLKRVSVDGRMQGDRQQAKTTRESRMERANRKGQTNKTWRTRQWELPFKLSGIPVGHARGLKWVTCFSCNMQGQPGLVTVTSGLKWSNNSKGKQSAVGGVKSHDVL